MNFFGLIMYRAKDLDRSHCFIGKMKKSALRNFNAFLNILLDLHKILTSFFFFYLIPVCTGIDVLLIIIQLINVKSDLMVFD